MVGENRQKKGSGLIIDETQRNETVVLMAGVDAGSTETRVCLADAADADVFADTAKTNEAMKLLSTSYRIPSTYANVTSAREIATQTQSLEDNYDSVITLIRNKSEKPLIDRVRVIRGRKIQDAMGVTPRYLDSSTSKTDNVIFYVNIIDALGYAILQKYNGRIPKEVNVYLTLSVRPKELTSICKNRIIENLVGTYVFVWRDVEVRITIRDLSLTTEPEAQISGNTTMYDLKSLCTEDKEEADKLRAQADKMYDTDCYVHIEGGGSSVGVEVVRGGNIIDAASATFPLGGNYMAQVFIDRYREASGRTVTKEAANTAVIECVLRDGRNSLDVSAMVADVKNQVALDIVERLRHEVVDIMSDLTMHDIEFISLGGRLFAPDACGGTIGDYFRQYINQISSATDVVVLPENYIAQGNLVIALNSEMADHFNDQGGEESTAITEVEPEPVVAEGANEEPFPNPADESWTPAV